MWNQLTAFLGRFFPTGKRIVDPAFGEIVFNNRNSHWRTITKRDIAFGNAFVGIQADHDGPSEAQRKRFVDFQKRWPELRAELEAKLLYELTCYRDCERASPNGVAETANMRYPTTPAEVWRHLRLWHFTVFAETVADWVGEFGVQFEKLGIKLHECDVPDLGIGYGIEMNYGRDELHWIEIAIKNGKIIGVRMEDD